MATQRTFEEKSEILAHCLELERTGGDILAYLWSKNYLTPRATWCNYQREWLHRKPYEFTDGRPKVKKKKETKDMARLIITDEQKLEAAEIAIKGGSPFAFLKGLGAKNPGGAWYNVKQWLEKTHPDVLKKIPTHSKAWRAPKEMKLDAGGDYEISAAEAMDNMKDAADEFFGKCEEAGLNLEEKTITAPVSYDGFHVRGISGRFGSYHFQDINGRQWIDYEDNESSNELSMTVEQWREFLDELRRAALVLGVEL